MCGEVKSKKDEKTASTPLVTVSDLQRMKMFEVIVLRLRKQPFKTKLTPNFKIDWGKKYPLAKYPTRAKREVHTFDIKEFVKNQKKKKLLDMMNAAEMDSKPDNSEKSKADSFDFAPRKSPFGPAPSPITPKQPEKKVSSERPDITSMPMFKDMETSIPKPVPKKETKPVDDNFNFDVDELVKKIDAKIAELEEEEKKNKEKQEASKPAVVEQKSPTVEPAMNKIENSVVKEPTTMTVPNNNIELEDDDNDDDFFDDFFDN